MNDRNLNFADPETTKMSVSVEPKPKPIPKLIISVDKSETKTMKRMTTPRQKDRSFLKKKYFYKKQNNIFYWLLSVGLGVARDFWYDENINLA